MAVRTSARDMDLSDILEEDVEVLLKEAAEVSMGTEIAEEDVLNIQHLCDQVVNIATYRASLYEYLKHRMNAIAPNLTVMVGELVGARLIAHAGSLINLAKQPASTVQILGAEKALFRALKTKRQHQSLIHTSTHSHTDSVPLPAVIACPHHVAPLSAAVNFRRHTEIWVDLSRLAGRTGSPEDEGKDQSNVGSKDRTLHPYGRVGRGGRRQHRTGGEREGGDETATVGGRGHSEG